MALNIRVVQVDDEDSTGPSMPGVLGDKLSKGALNAISKVDGGNMFGQPGTFVKDEAGWRVDRQNAAAGFVNISVQRNGIDAPSTVASVFVPTDLNIAPPKDGGNKNPVFHARIMELQNVTRRGLVSSLNSHKEKLNDKRQPSGNWVITRYEVIGEFSCGAAA